MAITIKTNNRTRRLFPACEVPYNEKESFRKEFDWMDDEEFYRSSFFKYRGQYYAMGEFCRTEGELLAKGWQGYYGESAWSCLLIKIKESYTSVVVGRAYW